MGPGRPSRAHLSLFDKPRLQQQTPLPFPMDLTPLCRCQRPCSHWQPLRPLQRRPVWGTQPFLAKCPWRPMSLQAAPCPSGGIQL